MSGSIKKFIRHSVSETMRDPQTADRFEIFIFSPVRSKIWKLVGPIFDLFGPGPSWSYICLIFPVLDYWFGPR